VDQPFQGSDEQQMIWLRDYLTAHGLTTTIRRSRGEDILAACGMLVNALQKEQ
jgi:23S rRNA (adenine2503-C2)-methyltransferase